MDGWSNGQMVRWAEGQTWMDIQISGRTYKWMDGRNDEQTIKT